MGKGKVHMVWELGDSLFDGQEAADLAISRARENLIVGNACEYARPKCLSARMLRIPEENGQKQNVTTVFGRLVIGNNLTAKNDKWNISA